MLLGIMCFVGCNDCHGNKKLLAQTDSLLQSRPDLSLIHIFFDNMEYMNGCGQTVFLDVHPDILFRRLRVAKQQRPILQLSLIHI